MKSRVIAIAVLATMLLLAACQQVGPKPTISSFKADPTAITSGGTVTLSWTVTGATKLTINNKVGDVTGKTKITVKPTKTTTYTLTATNSGGNVSKQVTVTVNQHSKPTISSFKADPTAIASGGTVTLSWAVTGATKLTINNGVGDVTGKTSVKVTPTKTTTYTLTATNSSGSVTAPVKVNVGAAPTISAFAANPDQVASGGGTTTLSWTVTGATKLTIDNKVGDVTGKTSAQVSVTKSTTFILTASNDFGSVTAQATVAVGDAPMITIFTADKTNVASGAQVTLNWTVAGDNVTLTLDPGAQDETGKTSTTVAPTQTTTYKLTATNTYGTDSKTVTVDVGAAPTISAFAASPDHLPTGGGTATLSWTVTGDGTVTLTLSNDVNSDTQDVSGQTSVDVSPTQTTTYTLTATSEYGTATANATVNVGPVPTITFSAAPTTVYPGTGSQYTTSTLTWNVTDADTVSIAPDIGTVAASGTQDVNPQATTTYTLTATNSYGGASETVTITAVPAFAQVFSDLHSGVGGAANFGLAVAVDGNTMVVGAPFQANPGLVSNSGMAYVYTYDGTSWSFATRLYASDGAADDNFGTSVAIRGGTILVGAPGHAVTAGAPSTTYDRAGAVYVFTGSGSTWTQSQELTEAMLAPTEVQADDQLGFSVAIDPSGDTFVAGANQCSGAEDIKTSAITISPQALGNCEPNPPGTGSGPGKAYVFSFNGTSWAAEAKLDQGGDTTSADGDDFGYSVSITTNSAGTEVVAVGSHGNAANGKGNSGAVYLFTSSTTPPAWSLADKLTPGDSQPADYFGRSVSLSGDTLLVGSVIYNGGVSPTYAGAAYVFDGSGGWSAPALQKKLTPDDAADNKYFGYYVALDGDIAVIGSQDNDTDRAGSVYVFRRNAGGADTWGQTDKLVADDANANANFDRVAINGQTIVVGSPTQTVGTTVKGEVYVFAPATTP